MRIAFDEQAFQLQIYGGISRYIVRIAEELGRSGETVAVFAPLHRNQHLRQATGLVRKGFRLPGYPPKTGRAIFRLNRLINGFRIPAWRPDVIHETFYSAVPLGGRRVPTVLTVHDMIYERYPELFPDGGRGGRQKLAAIARADRIICVSESTRRDLCSMTDVPAEKTVVVHHGVDLPDPSEGVQVGESNQGRPFLLYVGLRGGYKNFEGLLRGIGSSPRLSGDCEIVVFGGPALSRADYEAAAAAGISEKRIRHAGREESTLNRLYREAAAFVYPSLYEGFGMPPLEAMAHGCPVVCSHHASLPEVVGDAAETFDGGSPDDIGSAIERVVYSAHRRGELIAAGHRRAATFSWQRCARETRDVYSTVTGAGR